MGFPFVFLLSNIYIMLTIKLSEVNELLYYESLGYAT